MAGTLAGAATTAEPKPIPGGFMPLDERRYHAHIPGRTNPLDPNSPINEPSTITDFDGLVAIGERRGRHVELHLRLHRTGAQRVFFS